jgi:HrpA-like RNA helicase
LIFLPGQEDIESVHQLLEEHLPSVTPQAMSALPTLSATLSPSEQDHLDHTFSSSSSSGVESSTLCYRIYPLYAALSSEEQLSAFQPSVPGIRKIILATNIAETSVTISGIKYVIDPGKVKTRCMHPFTGADMLQVCSTFSSGDSPLFLSLSSSQVIPISQSQAHQRSGRAGRESAGKCYRLYTEDSFVTLQPSSLPEIQRVGIAQVILQLFAIGIQNPIQFPYISPPNKTALSKGLSQLLHLGALSKVFSLLSRSLNGCVYRRRH